VIWHDWPLDARDLPWLAWFAGHALAGLAPSVWVLRNLRAEEALERQWTLQDVRWRARDRAWREPWEERGQRLPGG